MRFRFGLVFAVVIVLLSPRVSPGQHRIFNGGFTTRVHGWSVPITVAPWSPLDADGSPLSGSLRIVNTLPRKADARGADQCIAGPAIVPGTDYDFGAMVRIPGDQSATGVAGLGLRWYPNAYCSGPPISQPRVSVETVSPEFSLVASSDTAPAGAMSVEFTVYATKSVDEGVFEIGVDNAYFGPSGTTFVPAPIVVPAAAHLVGLEGTNWRTDLEIHNPTGGAVSYTVAFLERGQANRTPLTADYSLAAGQSVRFDDVVASVFGRSGGGALRVSPHTGTLLVSSRTYNLAAGKTYGQFVPGQTEDLQIGYGAEARLVQLRHDGAYRTNLGIVNVVDEPITVQVDLYTSAGTLLGTLSLPLMPWEHFQADGVFTEVTSADVSDGYAVLRTTTPTGRFLAYGSVIDNASGDAILVPLG